MTCTTTKRAYASPQAAYAAIEHLNSVSRRCRGKSIKSRGLGLMNAYQCPVCREWHIGHRTPVRERVA